jgi:hypothetical protein
MSKEMAQGAKGSKDTSFVDLFYNDLFGLNECLKNIPQLRNISNYEISD